MTTFLEDQKLIQHEINKEMKDSYIDYAMSVIVGRALPDVRDGLKPVHRRILYGMSGLGVTPDKPHKKSARIVGEVMGKYHPHGDYSIYDAMVRLAQPFNIRYTLVDGHGNFGSVDGDGAAAMRYTEARMTPLALQMLRDIEKETVDFTPNFDGEEKEPEVLPSRFPNLLVNGSNGIAVGMATSIPPHNLCEVIDAAVKLIDEPEATVEDLIKIVKGPDFPTGAIIMGKSSVREAYRTGQGKAVVRAVAEIEETSHGKQQIIVTEIPYQVNKARLIEKIADLVRDKRVEGITAIRDESNRKGMRIVIELKRDTNANIVLNRLYKHTQMQDSFSMIMLALVDGRPKILNLREIISEYLKHQREVVTRRTIFDKKKAEARAHILEGYLIALDNIDEIIRIIRSSYNDAKEKLMERFDLSEIQAQAILDMQLRRLQGLEKEKIESEYQELLKKIAYYAELLGVDPEKIFCVSVMPCLAKKHECTLPNMNDSGAGQDVDVVLTTREVDRMIRAEHIIPQELEEEEFDTPLGVGTGAAVIFGATGGVMEAALRSAYYLVTGENPQPDAFREVRGMNGWKEASFNLAGTELKVAVASGLGNTRKLMEALRKGEVSYHFVEIMACPGGCVGGGGQPVRDGEELAEIRSGILYGLDAANELRFSHENPSVLKCYEDYFEKPLSHRAHQLLHTDHHAWKMPDEK